MGVIVLLLMRWHAERRAGHLSRSSGESIECTNKKVLAGEGALEPGSPGRSSFRFR